MPAHSAEPWSTATNTAAWPSPVTVVVRSVPHIVSIVSGMIVPSRPARRAGPRGGEQIVLAHQPQHPPPRGAGPAVAQPRPYLAVALAVERAGRQHRPDRFQQVGVRHRPGRARSPRGGRVRRLAMTVDSRAGGDAPGAADPREP